MTFSAFGSTEHEISFRVRSCLNVCMFIKVTAPSSLGSHVYYPVLQTQIVLWVKEQVIGNTSSGQNQSRVQIQNFMVSFRSHLLRSDVQSFFSSALDASSVLHIPDVTRCQQLIWDAKFQTWIRFKSKTVYLWITQVPQWSPSNK